jgi:alpha-beta hydrolase superfamily lysophospholipase
MVTRTVARIDVSDVAPPGCRSLAMEVVAPPLGAGGPGVILFCYPGGGMSRRYFDLAAAGYSFAEYAAQRGFVAVLADHPGVGDSDAPDDGWTLTPETIATVDAAGVSGLLALLRNGALPGLPPLDPAAVIAVAHSVGAHILVHHQAAHPQFDGVALLGWSARGLPAFLDDEGRELGEQPGPLAPRLVEGARRQHGEPLPVLRRGSSRMLVKGDVPPAARQALVDARAPLLAVAGYAAMVPGSARDATARIRVPVFLGVGEHDIASGHHAIPAEFPASRDITLFILEGAGHNHNVAPGRERLWDRIAGWADGTAGTSNGPYGRPPRR